MVGGYKVITLCGSTRFRREFEEANKRLTLAGNIVISVGLFGHGGDAEVWEGMDESTRSEIAYAEAHGKPVRYLEPICEC